MRVADCFRYAFAIGLVVAAVDMPALPAYADDDPALEAAMNRSTRAEAAADEARAVFPDLASPPAPSRSPVVNAPQVYAPAMSSPPKTATNLLLRNRPPLSLATATLRQKEADDAEADSAFANASAMPATTPGATPRRKPNLALSATSAQPFSSVTAAESAIAPPPPPIKPVEPAANNIQSPAFPPVPPPPPSPPPPSSPPPVSTLPAVGAPPKAQTADDAYSFKSKPTTETGAPLAAPTGDSAINPEMARAWAEDMQVLEQENQTLREKLHINETDRLSDIRVDAVSQIREDVLRTRVVQLEKELDKLHMKNDGDLPQKTAAPVPASALQPPPPPGKTPPP